MRVHEHRRGAARGRRAGELGRQQQAAFDVQVAVHESRRHVAAPHVDDRARRPPRRAGTRGGDDAVAHDDVAGTDASRGHIHDMAAGQHQAIQAHGDSAPR